MPPKAVGLHKGTGLMAAQHACSKTGEMLRQQWCLFYGTAAQLLAPDSGLH